MGMWVTDKTGCWHSLRCYFLGHLVLSQPELMKPECIVCFVVSGTAVEVRKSLWYTFETPLAVLPLFPSSFHPFLASPGERWCGRGVTFPQEEAFQTRIEACDQGDTGCLFSTGAECVTAELSVLQNNTQASSETGGTNWSWPLSFHSQPAPGTWVSSVPSPLSFLYTRSRSYSHSFCTHLIKEFSLASGTLVNQQRPKGQKACGSWDCFYVHSGSNYTVALCFEQILMLLSAAPSQRQLGRKWEAFGCTHDPCTHLWLGGTKVKCTPPLQSQLAMCCTLLCKGSCPKMGWKDPKKQFLFCWALAGKVTYQKKKKKKRLFQLCCIWTWACFPEQGGRTIYKTWLWRAAELASSPQRLLAI